MIKMAESNEVKKARLEGWRDALKWVNDQFFAHDHQMAMGEFKPAAMEMIKAKINWINSHKCFQTGEKK